MKIIPLDAPLGAEVHGFDFAAPIDCDLQRQLLDAVDEHLRPALPQWRQHADQPAGRRLLLGVGAAAPDARRSVAAPRLPRHQPGLQPRRRRGPGHRRFGAGDLAQRPDLQPAADRVPLPRRPADHLDRAATPNGPTCAPPTTRSDAGPASPDRRCRRALPTPRRPRLLRTTSRRATSTWPTAPRSHWCSATPGPGDEACGPTPARISLPRSSATRPRTAPALLAELYAHCAEERFVYRHRWQVGDACLWINTQTMHEREAFPADEVRVMRHVNILGARRPAARRSRARPISPRGGRGARSRTALPRTIRSTSDLGEPGHVPLGQLLGARKRRIASGDSRPRR